MYEDVELGVAVYWKYKEGAAVGGVCLGYEDWIVWLCKLIVWQEEMVDFGEMFDEVCSQVFDDWVYVFMLKGDVVDLFVGLMLLDFVYYIYSDVGYCCIGVKIGGCIVLFIYQLQMGDQIEIIIQKQLNFSCDWLNLNFGYVIISCGCLKIYVWFCKQDCDKNILVGR